MTSPTNSADAPVVFFDGVCNLCNGSVNFLIDHDPQKRLRFAPLQGRTFQELRSARPGLAGLGTIVLHDEEGLHFKSTAVLRVARALGGVWRLTGVFFVVPRFLRDIVYDFIARHRYRWFGKADFCRIPTPELRSRFLD